MCPACGSAVPDGTFCGCGVELGAAPALWRTSSAAPARFPRRPPARSRRSPVRVPHLEKPSPQSVRHQPPPASVAFSLLGLVGPLITVAWRNCSVRPVPVETDVYRDMPRHGLFVSAVIGTALGVGWRVSTGGVVDAPTGFRWPPGSRWSRSSVWTRRVVGGAFLMTLPAIVVRLLSGPGRESLDGFVIGALGALTFTGASTITNFAPQFISGLITNVNPLRLAKSRALRSRCAVDRRGLRRTHRHSAVVLPARRRRPSGAPLLLLFSLLVASLYGAVWVMEAARLPQITQLVFHLILALVAMFGLRVQMALLREDHDPCKRPARSVRALRSHSARHALLPVLWRGQSCVLASLGGCERVTTCSNRHRR